MPDYGRLLISPFPVAGDWLKVAQNQAFFIPYPPLPYIFWTSGHVDSLGPPVAGAKMHPEIPGNKYISSFGQLWVIQPPSLIKIIQKIQRVTIERKISSSKRRTLSIPIVLNLWLLTISKIWATSSFERKLLFVWPAHPTTEKKEISLVENTNARREKCICQTQDPIIQ